MPASAKDQRVVGLELLLGAFRSRQVELPHPVNQLVRHQILSSRELPFSRACQCGVNMVSDLGPARNGILQLLDLALGIRARGFVRTVELRQFEG